MRKVIEDTTATVVMTIAVAVVIFGLAKYSSNHCSSSTNNDKDYFYCIGL